MEKKVSRDAFNEKFAWCYCWRGKRRGTFVRNVLDKWRVYLLQRCKNFWSSPTSLFGFLESIHSFFSSPVGREKFFWFLLAFQKEYHNQRGSLTTYLFYKPHYHVWAG
jgi:hypothetical protein